jgi:hypothetical protein
VPGLHVERERDKFLCYTRAHGLHNADWSEALKGWLLEAHTRAMRRGDLTPPAILRPERASEPQPRYDPELHAQMRVDIARLEQLPASIGRPMPGTCHSRERSICTIEGAVLVHDPEYLAKMTRRREALRAQAEFLRAQEQHLEATSAAD